ncbi:iron dicitrate transport regulator FecR [Rhizorhabdus wittichii DC-6]|nr:iron dicitrate transport regulator FecR [Rhizorhabdus wittichii DC-6]
MTRETAQQIEDKAADWVARMHSATWGPDEEAELKLWLAADPRRDGALLQAQAALSMLTSADAGIFGENPPAEPRRRLSRRSFMGFGGAAVAASLGVAAVVFRGTSYVTDVGEIRRIPLADGSTAAINTDSAIAINLQRSKRLVKVDKGEAWFQVAKDVERPFEVEAGRIRVRAVGTAFSVRKLETGAGILVTEGTVDAWADGAEGQMIRISAGDGAFIGNNAAVERVPPEASGVDRALAWRSGKIDLVGQPLSEAVSEFNRYNKRKLVIVDPKLLNEQFDGVFRTDDPAGFAEMVKNSLSVPIDTSYADQILIGKKSS